jgi:PII-like signaling protein
MLNTHPDNPRRGDVGIIVDSLKVNGFYGAIVVQQSTGFILAGNHRFLAAIQENATEIPVIYVDVDDDEAKRIVLVDNKTSDAAEYDNALLAAMLTEMMQTESRLSGTGYSDADAQFIFDAIDPPPATNDPGDGAKNPGPGAESIDIIKIRVPRSQLHTVKTKVMELVIGFDGVTVT